MTSSDPREFLSRGAIPIAPALDSTLSEAHIPTAVPSMDRRVLLVSFMAVTVAAFVAIVAHWLTALIGLVTHFVFYGQWNTQLVSPSHNHLGLWVVLVPAAGGLIVGAMARWGSKAIRGHGIPEAMEQVLLNESRIPARMTWLKPLKRERVYRKKYPTLDAARGDVFEYIERFHNPRMRRRTARQDLKFSTLLQPSVEMG